MSEEANIEITLSSLKNEREKYTVRTLYDMCSEKCNPKHQHISFIVKDKMSLNEDEVVADVDI